LVTDPKSLSKDIWLSTASSVPCYRLESVDTYDTVGLKSILLQAATFGHAFFYIKIGVSESAKLKTLLNAGFSIVDTQLTFNRVGYCEPSSHNTAIEISDAQSKHHLPLQEIAHSCFRFSRFHQDNLIPNHIANLIKRKWIESYCSRSRGEALYCATIGNDVVGFLATLSSRDPPTNAVIDLIGVDESFQNQGVGRKLVAHFIRQWQSRVESLLVGTQIINRKSINLYLDFGFRLKHSQYVLHAHVRDGRIV